jgi:heme-degrading monooxygenase HmoA
MARCLTIARLTLDPGKRPFAEGVADQGVAFVQQQPGFQQVIFFIDESKDLYGAVSVWDSREAAEAADKVLTPGFAEAFGEHLKGEITAEYFEIYESTAT